MLKLLIIFLAAVAACCGQVPNMRVSYTLFKKNNQFIGTTITESVPGIFNSTQDTIFLIHGYAGNTVVRFNQLVRDAIFDFRNPDDYNVIVVDWTLEASFSYTQARNNVGNVARNLVNFIQWLTSDPTTTTTTTTSITTTTTEQPTMTTTAQPATINVENFHFVGFDLGAHVAGIAGRILQEDSQLVGRITGLSPSGRQWGAGSERLRRDDARYVEVIHTDTFGVLANGIEDPIGDINFYANGGNNQPGCLTHSCCHDRAFELFAASMINPNLIGRGCTSNTQMNLNLCRSGELNLGGVELSKTGLNIYRINTSRRYPFY
ncbi:lipase member I-like [Spodoptera litura]|uniref:Lipase member I-like n=1 Tax=Spodoptera litura TaxID=69820 RepID=A0A9J7IZK8_SPOLT|nr:lipase member I-like [Spodoptera litura]